MSRKNKQKRGNRSSIRRKGKPAVVAACPGCVADFCGGVEQSRMATRGPTLGFRVKHAQTGKYRSNIIWINPDFEGDWTEEWVRDAVKQSNK